MEAKSNAAQAKKVIWIVFIIALIIGVGLRYERTNKLVEDLGPVVEQINETIAENNEASVAIIQKKLTEQLGSTDSNNNTGYASLARVLVYHFRQRANKEEQELQSRFLEEINTSLVKNLILLSLIHTVLLSIFPGSFTISINRALTRVETKAKSRSDVLATFRSAVLYQRSRIFLQEEGRPMIWRRLAVFLLFSLSITYLMAPEGIYASIAGELLTIFPIPGDPTQPFWFAEFERVQPFVLGLAGFLVYSLITFGNGVITGELGNRMFLALWNRGITVVILSLVLTAMSLDSTLLNALIFVAGMFPKTGIQAIAKLAQRGAEQAAALNPTSLSNVPEIDSFGESALRTLGIFNVTDLAKSDIDELLKFSAIQPAVLLKSVDRALLLDSLGELKEKLANIPVYTASELLLYLEGKDAYMDRWPSTSKEQPRHLAEQLDAKDKQSRLNEVNAALEVKEISTQVSKLKATSNLQFIIDNALCYSDA